MAEHDILFKRIFAVPAQAADELRSVLPASVAARIDFDQLARMPGSYVTPQMRERHADLLLHAPVDGRDTYIYVLFEHQSEPDPLMPFRVQGYVHHIWEEYLRNFPESKTLPPIINVVFHHGKSGWTAPTTMHQMVEGLDVLPELATWIPNFELLIDDLAVTQLRALAARPMAPVAKVAIWILRDARNPEDLLRHLPLWARDFEVLVTRRPRDPDTTFLMEYIMRVAGDVPLQRILAELARFAPKAVQPMADHVQRLREEGLQRGLQQGLRQGVEQGREAMCRMLVRIAQRRFGPLEPALKQRIDDASLEQLERWADRIIADATLEETFAD